MVSIFINTLFSFVIKWYFWINFLFLFTYINEHLTNISKVKECWISYQKIFSINISCLGHSFMQSPFIFLYNKKLVQPKDSEKYEQANRTLYRK